MDHFPCSVFRCCCSAFSFMSFAKLLSLLRLGEDACPRDPDSILRSFSPHMLASALRKAGE